MLEEDEGKNEKKVLKDWEKERKRFMERRGWKIEEVEELRQMG